MSQQEALICHQDRYGEAGIGDTKEASCCKYRRMQETLRGYDVQMTWMKCKKTLGGEEDDLGTDHRRR